MIVPDTSTDTGTGTETYIGTDAGTELILGMILVLIRGHEKGYSWYNIAKIVYKNTI